MCVRVYVLAYYLLYTFMYMQYKYRAVSYISIFTEFVSWQQVQYTWNKRDFLYYWLFSLNIIVLWKQKRAKQPIKT